MTSKPPPRNKPLFGINNVLFSSQDAKFAEEKSVTPRENPNETLDLAFVPEHTDNEQSEEHTEQTMRIPVEGADGRIHSSTERYVTIRVISGAAMLTFQLLTMDN